MTLNKTLRIYLPFAKSEIFKQKLYEMILNGILDFDEAPRTEDKFNALILKTQEKLRGIGFRVLSVFEESLKIFAENMSRISASKKSIGPPLFCELESDLKAFITDILEDKTTLEIFLQYPRYLKAFAPRVEKALCEPAKYRQKRAQLHPFQIKLSSLCKGGPPWRELNELSQMIREFEVSLFAQNIKTLYPISEKRLQKKIETICLMYINYK